MSKLTKARRGIPAANSTMKMRPRKRTGWFVGNMIERRAHRAKGDGTALRRDWRVGEPLIVCKP